MGPNSTVTVSGGCELVVQATGGVSIEYNSTVRVSFFNMRSLILKF